MTACQKEMHEYGDIYQQSIQTFDEKGTVGDDKKLIRREKV